MITRSYTKNIKEDLNSKIVLISGPRQVGKTTLAKSLYPNFQYLNFDSDDDREIIFKKLWDRKVDLIIFDELHKMNEWKRWIKGIYDTEGVRPRLLITGSARLETYTNVGDSLAGRFFSYRLHPLDLFEMKLCADSGGVHSESEQLERLLAYSGFPEPYLKADKRFYNRWQKSHIDTILREDLIDVLELKNIKKMNILISLLRNRIGSPVSYSSLAEDLDVSYKTVSHWIEVLERLYILFRVTPYHSNIARSIKKEPKYYFYNIALVKDYGARVENLVACALKKRAHQLEDVEGEDAQLYYLRTRDGKEVDFFLQTEKNNLLIEVKVGDVNLSPHLKLFAKYFENSQSIQLVMNLKQNRSTADGAQIMNMEQWLLTMEGCH